MTTKAAKHGALGIETELFKAADKLRASMEPSVIAPPGDAGRSAGTT